MHVSFCFLNRKVLRVPPGYSQSVEEKSGMMGFPKHFFFRVLWPFDYWRPPSSFVRAIKAILDNRRKFCIRIAAVFE
jgi:hypothetical protein